MRRRLNVQMEDLQSIRRPEVDERCLRLGHRLVQGGNAINSSLADKPERGGMFQPSLDCRSHVGRCLGWKSDGCYAFRASAMLGRQREERFRRLRMVVRSEVLAVVLDVGDKPFVAENV